MSAASRLPVIAGSLSLSAVAASLLTLPRVREFLARFIGARASKNMWKLAALTFALLNFKNLPGIWHVRVLRGIFYQLYLQPTPQEPKHLFAPLITSSRNSLYDCDYNFHKSNSTYFADLDVARAHTVGCLLRTSLNRLNRGDEEGIEETTRQTKGRYSVALGAVSCFFQRQIEPLQEFEIYTRVLSWDRKWLYLVSHIVKKGAIKPDSYVLQPWKRSKRKPNEARPESEDLSKHIFATSVARYVFKKGRLTINPEVVLQRSRLLPKRPDGVPFPPRAEASSSASDSVTPADFSSATPLHTSNGLLSPEAAVASHVSSKLEDFAEHTSARAEGEDETWSWDDMEKERLRGLSFAVHFDKLSAVQSEFRAEEVLGQFGDYW